MFTPVFSIAIISSKNTRGYQPPQQETNKHKPKTKNKKKNKKKTVGFQLETTLSSREKKLAQKGV